MSASITPAASAGTLDEQGNRYWSVEVARMLPVYRDLYERIFAVRLQRSGVGGEGFVRRERGILVYGGPDELVRRVRPAVVAEQRLAEGNHVWVARLDREWREAAQTLEAATTDLRHALTTGGHAAEALAAVFEAKVALNALGVDSMLPDPGVATGWLKGHVADKLVAEVVDGGYLPASGEVAFDAYELESFVLARDTTPGEAMPFEARRRFVENGLFYRHDALDPRRRERVLVEMPREAASAARRTARGGPALAAAIEQISARAWRRRYHRQWAHQQLDAAEPRALALFDLAGSARDYDESKRRINMLFWRALFMLGDGLQIDLRDPRATARGLCEALARYDRPIPLDPVFSVPETGIAVSNPRQ